MRASDWIRSNVLGLVAIYLALGGTAVALQSNSIGPKQIKKSAVRSKHIKESAVGARQIHPAQVQSRIGASCPPRQAIREVAQSGEVVCAGVGGSGEPTGAAGGALAGSYPDPQIATNAVDTAKIASGAVTSAKLGTGAVTAAAIADSAVTNQKLAPGAVFGSRLADGAVIADKLANGAVTTDKIGFEQINAFKIQSAAITQAKISAGAVTGPKILDGAVGPTKILDGAVATTKILNGAVTGSKLAPGSVTAGKLGTIVQVSSSAVIAANDEGTVTAVCPAGSILLSGGGGFPVGSSPFIRESRPDGNGWSVHGRNPTGLPNSLQVEVRCLAL